MTAAIKAKMEAYRQKKEADRRRDEATIEAIRWNVTKTIVEHHPGAEFQWVTLEGPTTLRVDVRLNDYVWSYQFSRNIFVAGGHELNVAISSLLMRMEFDPLRQMFKT